MSNRCVIDTEKIILVKPGGNALNPTATDVTFSSENMPMKMVFQGTVVLPEINQRLYVDVPRAWAQNRHPWVSACVDIDGYWWHTCRSGPVITGTTDHPVGVEVRAEVVDADAVSADYPNIGTRILFITKVNQMIGKTVRYTVWEMGV